MAQIIVKEKDELKQWNESEFLLTLGNKEDLEFIPKDEAEMDARLESLNVSSNGEYYPSEGYDGFSEVDADVHPTTTRLEVTRNGTYRASSYGVEAFDYVSADCPTGEDEMTLESLEIAKNGKYYPPRGVDGFDEVDVSVVTDAWWEDRQTDFDEMTYDPTATYICYLGELHKLGGEIPTQHYVFRDDHWQTALEIPYDFVNGRAFVDEDGLHILGSSVTSKEFHNAHNYDMVNEHLIYTYEDVEDPETHEITREYRWDTSRLKVPNVCQFAVFTNGRYIHLLDGLSVTYEEQTVEGVIVRTAIIGGHTRMNKLLNGQFWTNYSACPIDISKNTPITLFKKNLYVINGDTAYTYDLSTEDNYTAASRVWQTLELPLSNIKVGFACDDGRAEKLHIISGAAHLSWNSKWWKAEDAFEYSVDTVDAVAIQTDLLNVPDFEAGIYVLKNEEKQINIKLNVEVD